MPDLIETDVLIAGGGPVGTTLALDLAYRGVRSIVLEERLAMPPNPKCNTTNARSMEHFRRLGCADAIRRAGLPLTRPTDTVYATRWQGKELTRYRLRSSQQVFAGATDTGAIDEYWPTPEPQHRISQLAMEPVLRARAQQFAECDYREGWRYQSFAQSADYVDCVAVELVTGIEQRIRCRYLVSCEGARSSIRNDIGAKLEGREVVSKTCTTYLRVKGLDERWPHAPGWMYRLYNRDGISIIVAIDGKDLWLHHSGLGAHHAIDLDAHDDRAAIRNAFGQDIEYEVLGQERWIARAMVANRYRNGRVFLCGDAAHIWIPMGGFGMNAGIEDAVNLSWKLAGRLAGWAPDALLDSYEAERRAIGQLVAASAVKITEDLFRIPVDDPRYEADGAEADAFRAEIGRKITERNLSEFDSIGMQLGVAYTASPIVCHDGATPALFAIDHYVESSCPGVRAPHFWRGAGHALFDDFGVGYTLLRIGAQALDSSTLEHAFAARGAPLKVLDVHEDIVVQKYEGFPLVLVRPDQHIAWRGMGVPQKSSEVVDTVTGAA